MNAEHIARMAIQAAHEQMERDEERDCFPDHGPGESWDDGPEWEEEPPFDPYERDASERTRRLDYEGTFQEWSASWAADQRERDED